MNYFFVYLLLFATTSHLQASKALAPSRPTTRGVEVEIDSLQSYIHYLESLSRLPAQEAFEKLLWLEKNQGPTVASLLAKRKKEEIQEHALQEALRNEELREPTCQEIELIARINGAQFKTRAERKLALKISQKKEEIVASQVRFEKQYTQPFFEEYQRQEQLRQQATTDALGKGDPYFLVVAYDKHVKKQNEQLYFAAVTRIKQMLFYYTHQPATASQTVPVYLQDQTDTDTKNLT